MFYTKANIPDFTKFNIQSERRILEDVCKYAKQLSISNSFKLMRFRDGYKYNEIASISGMCESTVSRKIKQLCIKLCKKKHNACYRIR